MLIILFLGSVVSIIPVTLDLFSNPRYEVLIGAIPVAGSVIKTRNYSCGIPPVQAHTNQEPTSEPNVEAALRAISKMPCLYQLRISIIDRRRWEVLGL